MHLIDHASIPLHSYQLVILHVCLKLSSSLEYHNLDGNPMCRDAEDKQYKQRIHAVDRNNSHKTHGASNHSYFQWMQNWHAF